MSQLKLLPIGGIGGVTKNMYLYEYQDQILIVDCGIGFPTAGMLGVDILIPDIDYLMDKAHQIVGMILTHGHDDHIAALPYILPKLPEFPIFGSKLTVGFAADRLSDFDLPVNFQVFPKDTGLKLGHFFIESIDVTHSVPDTKHYAITTPVGTVYHGSDFKFDLTPVDGKVSDYNKIARLGDKGILCLLSDCLRSEKEEQSLSESIISQTFEREIRGVTGKFIVTVMSSNIHRIQQAVNVAVAHGRKVAFLGRSIEQNVKTASKLGHLHLKDHSIVSKKRINKMPPEELCVIIAGSQGQVESSLSRAALGGHSLININPEDKVVFSSEPIPGNEDAVYTTIDTISRIGADVAYSDLNDNVHVSGHASAPEQKLLIHLTKPKYLMPIGGTYRHMVQYRKLARSVGYTDDQVFVLNDGQSLLMDESGVRQGPKVKLKHVMVDGTGVGDIGSVVLSDRKAMADSGMLVVVLPVDANGQLVASIEVVSRGFVFIKQATELINDIASLTETLYQKYSQEELSLKDLKKRIESDLADFIYETTKREPLIMAVIINQG